MLHIHEKIKRARLAAGKSQSEVAKIIGVGRSTYQYWEDSTPSLDNIKQVAVALNLPLSYFIDTDSDEFSVNEPTNEYGCILKGETNVTLQDYIDLQKDYSNLLKQLIEGKFKGTIEQESNSNASSKKAANASASRDQKSKFGSPDEELPRDSKT